MPSNPEMDLTRAIGEDLRRWFDVRDQETRDNRAVFVMLRDTILRQARAQWEQERGTPLTVAPDLVPLLRDAAACADAHGEHDLRNRLLFHSRELQRLASSPAPAVRALQREALERFAHYLRTDPKFGDKYDHNYANVALAFRDREYPDPAPPSVTLPKCERCGGVMPASEKAYANHRELDACVDFLAAQVKALLPPEDSTDDNAR